MAWLAVDKNGVEAIYNVKPIRYTGKLNSNTEMWMLSELSDFYILLPKGSIKKLIDKDLTWDDEPVKI